MCVFFILVSKGWVDHLWCLSCDIWYTSNITNITLNRFGILERTVSGIVQQVGRYRTMYSKIIRYLLDATRYLVFFSEYLLAIKLEAQGLKASMSYPQGTENYFRKRYSINSQVACIIADHSMKFCIVQLSNIASDPRDLSFDTTLEFSFV